MTPPAGTPAPKADEKPPTTLLNEPAKDAPKDAPKADDKKPDDKAAAGAPEKYADYKVPDGFEFVPEQLAEANTVFKELGLSQDQAQKVIDLYTKTTAEAADAPFKFWKEMNDGWVNEIKADPKIGGKLDDVRVATNKMIDGVAQTLGDTKIASDFRAAMDLTGAGNNPAFIRVFYQLAQMFNEARPTGSGKPNEVTPPNQPRTAAAAMYPNLPSASGG